MVKKEASMILEGSSPQLDPDMEGLLDDEQDEQDEEQGKMNIWYEVWDEIQKLELEIEYLSVEIEEQEQRALAFTKRRIWANNQKQAVEADAQYARTHKKFKIKMDQHKVAVLNKKAAEMKEKAADMAKQEREAAEGLPQKKSRLMRRAERRSRLYELLRSMNLG